MNVIMHLGLSEAIRNTVENELGIKINAYSFMYGNIKPDLDALIVKNPHFKHTAMEYVQAEIEKLAPLKLNESRRWSKQLSERIGVITHYLSDFFCYAHTEYFESQRRSHWLYEFRLLSYFQKNQKFAKHHISIKPTEIQSTSANIITYIEEAHEKYLKYLKDLKYNPLPYELDTANALNICISVCVSIISMCLNNQLKYTA